MSNKKQLLKAAKRLRKTARRVNRFDDRALDWVPTLIPKNKDEKHHTYWVDEHSVSNSGGEGYRTVADCLWHIGDINYIAMMHPPVALLLAGMLEGVAEFADVFPQQESLVGRSVTLAQEINKQWKVRAKHVA